MQRLSVPKQSTNSFIRLLQKVRQATFSFLFKVILVSTFVGILLSVAFICYYLLINFDPTKCLVGCLTLVTLIHTNKSVQA